MKKIEKLIWKDRLNYDAYNKINEIIDNQNEMIEKQSEINLDDWQKETKEWLDKSEPEKQMMICENWKECTDFECTGRKPHEKIYCTSNGLDCNGFEKVKCIPYIEQKNEELSGTTKQNILGAMDRIKNNESDTFKNVFEPDWQKELDEAKKFRECICYEIGNERYEKNLEKLIEKYESVIEKMVKEIEEYKILNEDVENKNGFQIKSKKEIISNMMKLKQQLKEKDAEIERLMNEVNAEANEVYKVKREILEEIIQNIQSWIRSNKNSTVRRIDADEIIEYLEKLLKILEE